MYPETIEANGRIYKINTDYRIGIACFKAINDDEITDSTRALAIITLLLGEDVKTEDYSECFNKCSIYLRCGKEENSDPNESDMDYVKDEKYIKTSIRQCYNGLNLNEIKYMHWYEYNELIEGLTEDTLFSKIRWIRNYDLSDEKDEKTKKEMKKAKDYYALNKRSYKTEKDFTVEEIENMKRFNEMMNS